MLKLEIPAAEYWDSDNEEFIYMKSVTLKLEFSLMAIADWESKYHKSFFNENSGSEEEFIYLIKCMTINKDVDEKAYMAIGIAERRIIQKYMEDPMTGATFKDRAPSRRRQEKITAETFYHQMIEYGIDFECQKWHLNRLLALIRFCQAKEGPQKKRPLDEIAKDYSSLNAARKAKHKYKH